MWFSDPKAFMLGTLLHECVHAFLLMACCSEYHHRSCPCDNELGATGHGGTWVRLASHVEAVAVEHLSEHCAGLIDLSISTSMDYEFIKSGQVPPQSLTRGCSRELRETIQQSSEEMAAATAFLSAFGGVDIDLHEKVRNSKMVAEKLRAALAAANAAEELT